jgi:uncharacterized protein YndB with AHSA1/START domain
MNVWLGAGVVLAPQACYQLPDGVHGEVTVLEPGSHLRLTWQPPAWSRSSILQIRVIDARTGTTISFHQENLPGPAERENMLGHWTGVLDRLAAVARDEGERR